MKNLKVFFSVWIPVLILITGRGFLPAVDTEEQRWMLMLAEEKLARDVYAFFDTRWNKPVFANISQSESHHMERVASIFERKGYSLPATGMANEPGVFEIAEIQSLYHELTTAGTVSLEAALKVGAWIEEKDIVDLTSMIADEQDADVRHILTALLDASHNHLRAFVRQLGNHYEPQLLSAATFEAIIKANDEKGMKGKQQQAGSCKGGSCKGQGGCKGGNCKGNGH